MAIYSLNHSSIGRSTHAAGTAAAHVGYITRRGAHAEVLAERMPAEPSQAQAWMEQAETAERKNGRVCDKVIVALPRELDAQQQAELIREFANQVTQGRASWLAAIHRDDPDNPHAHLVIRDKDPETGKRVAGLNDLSRTQRDGSKTVSGTERLRLAWEQTANAALLGKGVQIDRRSLKAQGIEQAAQIHVGPKAKAMEGRGVRPQSQNRRDHRERLVRWPEIDRSLVHGQQSRTEHNNRIVARNGQQARQRLAQEQARERTAAHAREQAAAEAAYAAERAREAQEARKATDARQAQEEAKRAQEARERAAADRYAALVREERTARAAGEQAAREIEGWSIDHPMRARLHRLGLKAGHLTEREGRIAAAEKARTALEADPEGKRDYEARETARKAQEAAKREAVRQERERQYQQKLAQSREQQRQKGPEKDGPGGGFSR